MPAERMRLSPVDRIFCRIGANDRLSAGECLNFLILYIFFKVNQHFMLN